MRTEACLGNEEAKVTGTLMETMWTLFFTSFRKCIYRIVPKFSDRQVWANSVDPDQTAPRSSLIRVFTVCYSVYVFWTNFSIVRPCCSNFRILQQIFWVSEYLGNLR